VVEARVGIGGGGNRRRLKRRSGRGGKWKGSNVIISRSERRKTDVRLVG